MCQCAKLEAIHIVNFTHCVLLLLLVSWLFIFFHSLTGPKLSMIVNRVLYNFLHVAVSPN